MGMAGAQADLVPEETESLNQPIGLTEWATALKLGAQFQHLQYSGHLAILIFALFLRPRKDHKY
ncbi:cytochrome b561 and DOMON domain-containing protein [Senna tora]|uniref:Cytochrome b561 and DOMON domain-containing protein n=1 Tax=Senna tora TaxID=362788 RepID=A0A834XHY2_9FABA|nr:cytochrome b561 and DOMON domain-containing protein [Senna tora]